MHVSGSPDVWASIVAGRRPSYSDQPKPRHVPGTTMTLHAPDNFQYPWPLPGVPQMHSVQSGSMLSPSTFSTLTKSPSSPSSLGSRGSYQSPGQISPGQRVYPWHKGHSSGEGQDYMTSESSQGNISPGQVEQSTHSPVKHLPDLEEIKEQNAAGSLNAQGSQRSKVTFSLTDSSSSKSTESGFSEHVGKSAETYASVCTKCKSALDHSGNHSDNNERSKSTQRHKGFNNDNHRVRSASDVSDRNRGRSLRGHGNFNKRGQYINKRTGHLENQHGNHFNKTSAENNSRKDKHTQGRQTDYSRGRGHFPRRGQRGQYYKQRNFKDRYHEDGVSPGSEPIFLQESGKMNVPIRRAVSSPDKTYDYNEIHFKFDNSECNDGNKSSDVDVVDMSDVNSKFTSKLTLNMQDKTNNRTFVDKPDCDNTERQKQPLERQNYWTYVDYSKKKLHGSDSVESHNTGGQSRYQRGGCSPRSPRGYGRGDRGQRFSRGRGQNMQLGSHMGFQK